MKTVEEAAREIFPNPDSNQITAFELGAEFAQRWIPIEEELPSDLSDILVKSEDGSLTVGYRFQDKWVLDIDINPKITHWRPIELK